MCSCLFRTPLDSRFVAACTPIRRTIVTAPSVLVALKDVQNGTTASVGHDLLACTAILNNQSHQTSVTFLHHHKISNGFRLSETYLTLLDLLTSTPIALGTFLALSLFQDRDILRTSFASFNRGGGNTRVGKLLFLKKGFEARVGCCESKQRREECDGGEETHCDRICL